MDKNEDFLPLLIMGVSTANPTPPLPDSIYTDRDGNYYVDRNGNYYVPRPS